MTRTGKAFFLAALIVVSAFALAQEAPAPANQLDEMFSFYHKFGQFNGAVLVARDGRVLYEKGFGYANVEWQIPNSVHTRYRIASVTKTFTATLVMQEVQRGAIDLDAPITKYVPEFRADTGGRVTIRQMLAHTSGIPNYSSDPKWRERLHEAMPREQFLKSFCFGDLTFEPGTKWAYSNCAYTLLAIAVERTSGKSYEQLLTERILKPLGMAETGVDKNSLVLPMRGYGYRRTLARTYEPAPHLDLGQAFGAGDLYSTVEDLLKWDQAFYGDKLLTAKTRELMFTKSSERTGLGWFVTSAPPSHPAAGRTLQFHEGNIYYWMSLITRVPEERLFVAIISNTGDAPMERMTASALDIVLHGNYERPKQSVADVIAPILVGKGVVPAVAEYRRLKQTSPETYDFGERPFNAFGYEVLRDGRTNDAIEIFRLNAEMYPNSANVYDSLAEAYERDGQRELAGANYEKALKLEPSLPSSVAGLKRLGSAAGK